MTGLVLPCIFLLLMLFMYYFSSFFCCLLLFVPTKMCFMQWFFFYFASHVCKALASHDEAVSSKAILSNLAIFTLLILWHGCNAHVKSLKVFYILNAKKFLRCALKWVTCYFFYHNNANTMNIFLNKATWRVECLLLKYSGSSPQGLYKLA